MAEFQEADLDLPDRSFRQHPTVLRIEKHLNQGDIKDVFSRGPKGWARIVGNIIFPPEKNPTFERVDYKRQKVALQASGLPFFEHTDECLGISGAILGCKLPEVGYRFICPPVVSTQFRPSEGIPATLPEGDWITLPTSTVDNDPDRFNNGFYILTPDGRAQPSGKPIMPFKGSIGFVHEEDPELGRLYLYSPQESQDLINKIDSAKAHFPHGGYLLGAPLIFDITYGVTPTIQSTIQALEESRYFSTYNHEVPFFIRIGLDMYYINTFLPGTTKQALKEFTRELTKQTNSHQEALRILQEKYARDLTLLAGTHFALKAAASLLQPGQTARIAMTEQNDIGELRVDSITKPNQRLNRALFATPLRN